MFTSFIVENLRAVSHFKHGTFSVLQYAMGFGTISKELNGQQSGKPVILPILRRTTQFLWQGCHSVALNLWPHCQQKVFQKRRKSSWKNVQNITDQRGREPLEARQRKTKQELRLPPAVYEKAKTGTWSELSFKDTCAKGSTASVSRIDTPVYVMWLYGCHFLSVTKENPVVL